MEHRALHESGNAERPARPRWYSRLADKLRSARNSWRERWELTNLKVTALHDPFDGQRAVKELARKGQFGILADVAVSASDSKNAGDATHALFRHEQWNELAFVAVHAEKEGIRRFAERLCERRPPQPEEA